MAQWVVHFNDEEALQALQQSLRDGAIVDDEGRRYLTEREIGRVGPVRIDILSDEHAPPHFRANYQGETANYTIDDCTKISGKLDQFYRNIRKWHSQNKDRLISCWNTSRPTDCPCRSVSRIALYE
jgi:hypothetical protein